MALPWVLVNRMVRFVDGEGSTSRKGKAAAAIGGSMGALSGREAMEAMKPNPVIVAAPEVSSLYMVRRSPADDLGYGVHQGEISCTHEGLVVLYTGWYRPGHGGFSGDGCYMIYDASNNAVYTSPPFPYSPGMKPFPNSPGMKGLGRTAVVLRQGPGGDYSLAELVTTFDPGFPEAELGLWSGSFDGQWIKIPVRLPLPADLCGPRSFFEVDMAFPLSSSTVCWVDLLTGVLVCDLTVPETPCFRFIPLPMGCELYVPDNTRSRMEPETFRSMAFVRGAIKFVSLEGFVHSEISTDDVKLRTWTLSHDFSEWKECKESWSVGEIWASESFKEMKLPSVKPMCPVLSMNQDEIIYAILNEVDHVQEIDESGAFVGANMVPKAHYMIEVDLLQKKVLKSTKISTGDLSLLTPTFLASEFSAYLQAGNKDNQSAEEESKVQAAAKRVKY